MTCLNVVVNDKLLIIKLCIVNNVMLLIWCVSFTSVKSIPTLITTHNSMT